MANPINTNKLKPGSTVMIRGRLQFSRLTSQFEGKELEERNKKAKYPSKRPYTVATICDARVLAEDPENPNIFEQWAQYELYESQADGATGYSFSRTNKSDNLPWIGEETSPGVVNQVYPEGELAKGLDVTLVLSAFKTQMNNGVGLDGVIVHEPIRLFSNNDPASVLKQHGFNFIAAEKPTVEPEESKESEQPTEPNYEEDDTFDEDVEMVDNNPQPQQMPQNPFGQNQNQGGLRYNPEDRGY